MLAAHYDLNYLADVELGHLPDFLYAAVKAEAEKKKWEAWLAFAPWAAIAGKEITPDQMAQMAAQQQGRGSDEDIDKIRAIAEQWGRK